MNELNTSLCVSLVCTPWCADSGLFALAVPASTYLSISRGWVAGSRPACVHSLPLHQPQQLLVVGVARPGPPVARDRRVRVRPPRVAAALQARAVVGGGADETGPRALEFRVSPLENLLFFIDRRFARWARRGGGGVVRYVGRRNSSVESELENGPTAASFVHKRGPSLVFLLASPWTFEVYGEGHAFPDACFRSGRVLLPTAPARSTS